MPIWLIIVLSIAVLLAAFSMYYILTANAKKEKFENDTKKDQLKVMLFYATWCPHCERYLESGKYEQISKALAKSDGKVAVVFEKYDYDHNKALGDTYNITSFPTIIAVDKNEKVFRFYGDRNSQEDMAKFVEAALEGKHLQRNEY
jgi:thiol-disulfide isomerase/thioredoxin